MPYAPTPLQDFVAEFCRREPKARNGGIAPGDPNQGGYHNSRNKLYALGKTSDYSVRANADLAGPGDAYCAFDIVFIDAQAGDYATIRKYMTRIRDAWARRDPRLNGWREFLGQQDQDSDPEGFDIPGGYARTPDMSHMWHIHGSAQRQFVESPHIYQGLLEICFPASGGSTTMGMDFESWTPPTIVGTRPRDLLIAETWTGMMRGEGAYGGKIWLRTEVEAMRADMAALRAGLAEVKAALAEPADVDLRLDADTARAVADALATDTEFIQRLAVAFNEELARRQAS